MIAAVILPLCIATGGFILVCLLVLRFTCLVVTIKQQSMYPTLAPGDRILVLRRWPTHWLRKGTIVIVNMKHGHSAMTKAGSSASTLYVKRIVGVGGETFLTTQEGEERIAQGEHVSVNPQQRLWPIPPSSLLVRGDNRANSVDSHVWGPVPVQCVQAMMLLRLPRTASARAQQAFLHAAYHPLAVGDDAPAFSASTLEGTLVNLQTYRHHALLLVFFHPARVLTEHFFLHGLQVPGMKEGETRTVLVSGSSAAKTRRFFKEVRVDLPVIIAQVTVNSMFHDYKVALFPYYCYIDTHGKILSTGSLSISPLARQAGKANKRGSGEMTTPGDRPRQGIPCGEHACSVETE